MELRELPPALPKPSKRVLVRSSSSGTRDPTSTFSLRPSHQHQHQHQHYHRKGGKEREAGTSFSGLFRRNADRQLAALHFLSNIQMKNERAILEAAALQQQQQQQHYPLTEGARGASPPDGEEDDDDELLLLDSPLAAAVTTGSSYKENDRTQDEQAARYGLGSVPGKKLDGPPAYVVSVPESFRHKYQQSAAVVRQWERQVSDAGILEGRLFISSKRGYPLVVSSVIQYRPGSESEKRLRAKQVNERGAEAFDRPVPDWRGVRYCRLLHAEWAPCSAERDARDGGHHQHELYGGGEGGAGKSNAGSMVLPCGVGNGGYDPAYLDDPALSHGRTRQLNMGGPGLGPVVFSIILFRNPRQLKDELNRQFREQHPSLPPSLTLSKIRRLKKQAAQGCMQMNIELGTLALGCVYFEKLCLQHLVTKTNRRLAFATCMVLAYKFQEQGLQGEGGWEGEGRGVRSSSAAAGGASGGDSVRNSNNKLSVLLEWFDREWVVSKRQIFDAEMGVYYHLGFALHVPSGEPQFHFVRLCRSVGVSPREYLGEERLRAYMEAAAGMVPGVVGWREGEEEEEEEEEVEEGGGEGEEEEEEDDDDGLEDTMHGDRYQEEEEEEELEGPFGWRRGRLLRRQGQQQRQRRAAVSLPAVRRRRDFEMDEGLVEENVPDALTFFDQESPGRGRGLEEEEEDEEEEEKKQRRRPSWTMRWKLGRRQTTV